MLTLTNSELALIEKFADEEFAIYLIPHPVRDIALWRLLTVTEDSMRMLFSGFIENI